MTIPKKFYIAGNHPRAFTIGELKKLLSELPDDLPLRAGFANGAELVVFNHGDYSQHLQLQEIYPDDEDDEDDLN